MSKIIFSICFIHVFIQNVDGKEIPVSTKLPTPGNVPSHIETSATNKQETSTPPVTPAGRDIFPKRTKSTASDVKPRVYPDQLLFRAETIANSTATTLKAKLRPSPFSVTPVTIEKDSINYRISGQLRDDPIQNQTDAPASSESPGSSAPPANTEKIETTKATAIPPSKNAPPLHSPLEHKDDAADDVNEMSEYTFSDIEWVTDKRADWILQYLQGITKKFPKTTRLVEVGKSKDNLPIYAVEISHKIASGATIVIDAGYDATDRLGISFAVYVIHQLLDNLTENLVTLMGVKIIVVPLINPDNYERNIAGASTQGCRENLFTSYEIGTEAVDHCPGFFRDVEVVAVSQYYESLTKFKLFFTVDSGTPTVGYPFGYIVKVDDGSREMAENMAEVIAGNLDRNISTRSLNDIFGRIDGTPIDWARSKLDVPYCVYLSLERVVEEGARVNIVKAYFESVRYGILQLQLTDVEIARAIYDEFDALSSGRTFFISVGVLMLVIIADAWSQ